MKILTPAELRRQTDPATLKFKTTADLQPGTHIIGQPRGTRAIEFGVGIKSHGYNIFVLGEPGTGRATAIQQFLRSYADKQPPPPDWVYVYNFSTPHKPRAISLPTGQGAAFQSRMVQLIQDLKRELPQAFDTETYRETLDAEQRAFDKKQNELLLVVQQAAGEAGFGMMQTPQGFTIVPLVEGQPMQSQQLQALPPEARQELEEAQAELVSQLDGALGEIHKLERETRERMKALDTQVAETAVHHHFATLQKQYEGEDEVQLYLEEVHQDVLAQIDFFAPRGDDPVILDLRRYEVNLLVDNTGVTGAPVILETNPSFHQIFGRLEYEMYNGALLTHFANIKPGSLHEANGGYLIVSAHELLKDGRAWEALKRSLHNEEIRVQPLAQMETNQVLAKSLDPEPIPLSLKIVLMGSPRLYYLLHEQDMDFLPLFKVRADFDTVMPRVVENEHEYALFVAARCVEEELRPFDQTAVAKVIEFGSRLADEQGKLSTRFGAVSDLVREASYWAERHERETVTAVDVQQALTERIHRANRIEEQMQEQIIKGTIFIATEGTVVGQVNGLSVLDTGEYMFGQPGRITARTFMGDDGVIHIERETDMSGPLHQKGVLTLVGYLGGTYAQNQPLSLTASLTFEQNYGGIDGDSASSTELYALLSSLSNVPIKQSIAVTGSVNQRGEVQPIGGVNEKIEGFYHLCAARGLTGEQGVMIPESNVENLMLAEEVVTAVAEGKFHIWTVRTIDEGIEQLMDMPAGQRQADGRYPEGTLHNLVQARLLKLATDLSKFGDDEEE